MRCLLGHIYAHFCWLCESSGYICSYIGMHMSSNYGYQIVVPIDIPTSSVWEFQLLTSLPILDIINLLNVRSFITYIVVSHWGFNLYFPGDQYSGVHFYVYCLFGYLLFRNANFSLDHLFLNGFVEVHLSFSLFLSPLFLVSSYKNILCISILHHLYVLKKFSPDVWDFFSLF